MIISDQIEIKIASSNINYYKELGYIVKVKDILTISVENLPKNSNYKIEVECDLCGSNKLVIYNAYNRYLKNSPDGKYRCNKCNIDLKKKTSLEKYGDYMNRCKYRNTCIEKYGESHYNKIDFFKNKIKNTNLEKYGVEYPMQNIDVIKKYKETIKEKYGVEYPMQNMDVIKKSFSTMVDKYGYKYSMQIEEIRNKIIENSTKTKKESIFIKNDDIIEIKYDENLYISKCPICKNNYEITPHMYSMRKKYNTIICTICNKIGNFSSGEEIKLSNFIKNVYHGEILLNIRSVISPYELDIYLPELNLAFEFNGVYWHSELYKEKNYHKIKSDLCDNKGIQLIHVWEDDWTYKQEIIKSMILNKLKLNSNKIFARKCEIKEVSNNKLISIFLESNHMQGYIGSSVKLGLFFNNELVSLMTFGKKRKIMNYKSRENEFELLRFCNKLNTTVVGGATRLFNNFIKIYDPVEVLTYADRSYSNGNLYNQLGFTFISKTDPNYYYIIDGVRKHRFGFRKDILIKEGHDPSKTEDEIMSSKNIKRIYNAGNLKFIYK